MAQSEEGSQAISLSSAALANGQLATASDASEAQALLLKSLFKACDAGEIETIKELLTPEIEMKVMQSLLLFVTNCGYKDVLRFLLRKGQSFDNPEGKNLKNEALFMAVTGGQGECIELLLSAGADPGALVALVDTSSTAIMEAIRTHQHKLLELLIAAKPAGIREGGTLISAARCNNKKAIELLLDKDPSLIYERDANGSTALMAFIQFDDFSSSSEKMFGSLCGPNYELVNATNKCGCTAIFYAAVHDNYVRALQLLERGASINIRDNAGMLPVEYFLSQNPSCIDMMYLLEQLLPTEEKDKRFLPSLTVQQKRRLLVAAARGRVTHREAWRYLIRATGREALRPLPDESPRLSLVAQVFNGGYVIDDMNGRDEESDSDEETSQENMELQQNAAENRVLEENEEENRVLQESDENDSVEGESSDFGEDDEEEFDEFSDSEEEWEQREWEDEDCFAAIDVILNQGVETSLYDHQRAARKGFRYCVHLISIYFVYQTTTSVLLSRHQRVGKDSLFQLLTDDCFHLILQEYKHMMQDFWKLRYPPSNSDEESDGDDDEEEYEFRHWPRKLYPTLTYYESCFGVPLEEQIFW